MKQSEKKQVFNNIKMFHDEFRAHMDSGIYGIPKNQKNNRKTAKISKETAKLFRKKIRNFVEKMKPLYE